MAEPDYSIPFRMKLPEAILPGQRVTMMGKVGEDAQRFSVNFHNGSADLESGNDVPFQMSFRFDEGEVVFNTFSKGEWGKDERVSNPYKKGDEFHVRVYPDEKHFAVHFRKIHGAIVAYEHRLPLSDITHFSIEGDVEINKMYWDGSKTYAKPRDTTLGRFATGYIATVAGWPWYNCERFHINILKKNGDIALHFNPRFDLKVIVLNSMVDNVWGNEEREAKFPLEKGAFMEIEIRNEESGFQIHINGEPFALFAHRMKLDELTTMHIEGDIKIHTTGGGAVQSSL